MNPFLDHLIWVCADLERGVRRFEALTGVTPHYGGVHASGLTHNALIALDSRCYLEILAPTGPESREDDAWCRLARAAVEPHLLTYCLRSARPLDELALLAARLGARNATVLENGRTTPDGVRLAWRWLAPVFERFGLAFPFFIDWLDSPHPAEMLAPATAAAPVRLKSFTVGHPYSLELERLLADLGFAVDTVPAPATFQVTLETPLGTVSL